MKTKDRKETASPKPPKPPYRIIASGRGVVIRLDKASASLNYAFSALADPEYAEDMQSALSSNSLRIEVA